MDHQRSTRTDTEQANMSLDQAFYGEDKQLLGSWTSKGSPLKAEQANLRLDRAFYGEENAEDDFDLNTNASSVTRGNG